MKRAALLLAAVAACSGTVPLGSISCRNDGECPTGAYCTSGGKCDALPTTLATPSVSASLDAAKTGINLSWARVAGATSYDVQRGPAAGAETFYATVQAPTTDPVSYSDPSPGSGVTQFYKVVAKGAGSPSAPSAEVSALTAPAAPATVTAAAGGVSVTVTWSQSAGATGYRVLRDGSDVSGLLPGNQFAYTDSTVAAGGTFGYSVRATNASGDGPASAVQSVTLLTLAPVLTAQLSNAGTTTSIKLSWTRPSGTISYQLYKGASVDSETLAQTLTDPTATFTDVETTTALTLHFHVVAVNSASSGTSSNDLAVTTVPPVPAGVSAALGATGGVDVRWTESASAGSYVVSRSDGTTVVNTTVQSPASSMHDATVQPSTAYSYTVAARDSTGALVSDASAPQAVTTPVPAPANVAAAPVDDTNVEVSWDIAPAGVDSYDVFRGTTAGGEDFGAPVNPAPVANSGSGGRVTFIDSGRAANTSYFYKVIAYKSGTMQSVASSEATVLTYFPTPTGLTVSAGVPSDTTVFVSWTRPAGSAFTYDILRGFAAGQEFLATTFVDSGTGSINVSLGGEVPGGSYFFKVRVHDPASGNVSQPVETPAAFSTTLTSPPANLSVRAIDATHVGLSVSHLTGFDTYDFCRSTTLSACTSTAATCAPATPGACLVTVFAPEGNATATDVVSAAGTYSYTVRARWIPGAKATPYVASLASVTTPPPPPSSAPSVPPNLFFAGAGAGRVYMQWSGDAAATSYTVRRNGTNIGTTSNFWFIDTAGPSVGSTASYSVFGTNTAGGGPISTATSPAMADPSVTFLCSAPRVFRYYSDGPTTTSPNPGGVRIVTSSSSTAVTFLPDGSCIYTALPPSGPFFVKSGLSHFLVTSRVAGSPNTMDLSQEIYDRQNSNVYGTTTPISFTLGNLDPWTANSHLELITSNLANGLTSMEQNAIAGAPAVGATSLAGLLVDPASDPTSDTEFIDSNAGDKPVLVELSPRTSSNGISYTVATRSYAASLAQADGRQIDISNGNFADLTATATTVPFTYKRSLFKALAPSINPAAAANVASDSIIFQAVPRENLSGTPGPAHPFISSYPGDVLSFNLDNGTTDVNAGTILMPTPYPSTWYYYGTVATSYTVPIGCGTAATSTLAPYQYGTTEEIIDDQADLLSRAATGITPPWQPATSPTIQPTSLGGGPQSAFTDRLGVTLNPTLSWGAVTSSPTPTYYRIFIYRTGAGSSSNCTLLDINGNPLPFSNPIAQLYTTGTSITIPTGILVNGSSYFAAIRPTYEPERQIDTAPLLRGQHEFFVETVTNRFVP